uniref:Protein CNPPD1 n=1 Tax=Heterorhabditis bacteriophora TaxID=37862 RepID=A0A1I7WQ76_HETBA
MSPQFSDFQLVVDYFDKNCPFDYMQPETSTSLSRGYADPCALVIAMVYLDRLRLRNKDFFDTSDPTELYLPALVLASKFLHDSDTCDSAKNSHWIETANISTSYLNNLEWKFIKELHVSVTISTRRGSWIFNRVSVGGMPYDLIYMTR